MKRNLVLLIGLLGMTAIFAAYFFVWPPSSPPVELYFGKVVFGHEQTPETTKLFIVRGREIFLDENADHVPQDSELIAPHGKTKIQQPESTVDFEFASIDVGVSPELVSENRPQKLILYVDVLGEFKYQMTGQLELATTPAPNDYLHFGGPLQFLALEEVEIRENESEPQDIKIYLGTPTENPLNTTVVAPNQQPPFPEVKISFEMEGEETEERKLTMDYFC